MHKRPDQLLLPSGWKKGLAYDTCLSASVRKSSGRIFERHCARKPRDFADCYVWGHAYPANGGPTSYVIDYKEPFKSDPGLSNPQDFRRAEFVSNSSYLNIHIFRFRLQIT
jgi:hypothetical protein